MRKRVDARTEELAREVVVLREALARALAHVEVTDKLVRVLLIGWISTTSILILLLSLRWLTSS